MKHNLKIIRGDDTTFSIKLRQNNAMYDLSDVERIDLHAKVKSKTVLRLSTTDNTITYDNERLLLHFTHQATAGQTYTSADYDLQIVKNGKVKTVMWGRLDMQHDIAEVYS